MIVRYKLVRMATNIIRVLVSQKGHQVFPWKMYPAGNHTNLRAWELLG